MFQTIFIDLIRGDSTSKITQIVNKVYQFLLLASILIRKIFLFVNVGHVLHEEIICRPTMRKQIFTLTIYFWLDLVNSRVNQGMREVTKKNWFANSENSRKSSKIDIICTKRTSYFPLNQI